MGLLSEGSPLNWEETKKLADHVRKHGVIQFINLYKRLRDRQGDVLKWGDEVILREKKNVTCNFPSFIIFPLKFFQFAFKKLRNEDIHGTNTFYQPK